MLGIHGHPGPRISFRYALRHFALRASSAADAVGIETLTDRLVGALELWLNPKPLNLNPSTSTIPEIGLIAPSAQPAALPPHFLKLQTGSNQQLLHARITIIINNNIATIKAVIK